MVGPSWLVRDKGSNRAIITAPDASSDLGEAITELEGALDGYGGAKPVWFRFLERLGYWWYPICMVIMSAVFLLYAPNGAGLNIAYGLGFGVAFAVLSGQIAALLSRLQVRLRSGRDASAVIKEVAGLARPGGGVADRVDAILKSDPSMEREVHLLAWRAAGIGEAGRSAANDELDELWRRADPAAFAAREARLREIEEHFADIKRRERD